MSACVTECIVADLRVSFNATVEESVAEQEDAILECLDGKRFAVARRELAANSGFFKGLFKHSTGQRNCGTRRGPRMRGKTTSFPVYSLPLPVTSRHLSSVLCFIHEQTGDSLELTEDNVIDVAMLADFLDVQDIIEECIEFMVTRLSSENVCGLWKFSQMYRLADLESASLRFLCENFFDVCLQEEFPNLCCDDLSRIFCSFDLGRTRQEDLWLSLVRWISADLGRNSEIQDLSKHILFGLIEKSFMEEQVVRSSFYKFLDKDLAGELLFLFGGDYLDSRMIVAYNSTTDRWRRLGLELPDPELAPGDYIQAVYCDQGIFFKRSVNCYWLDLKSLIFTSIGHFEKRMPAITVLNGEVHLLGGSYLTSWEVYCPRSRTWRDMWPNLRQGRVYGCAAVVKNKIYVLGGQTVEDKDGVADCEGFDTVKQCWVRIAPMEVGRTLFACAVLDGEIYVVGGQTGGVKTGHCEKYNPVTGTWSRLPDLLVPRRGHVAVVLEQVVFVIGGDTETAEWLDSEEGTWVETRSLPSSSTGAGGCVAPVGW